MVSLLLSDYENDEHFLFATLDYLNDDKIDHQSLSDADLSEIIMASNTIGSGFYFGKYCMFDGVAKSVVVMNEVKLTRVHLFSHALGGLWF
ncbi:hypothetical protein DAPPUDRAFT_334162 [Daphnia pulex]|uniref:Uncharacterized protein n=1 Tax=Daphnia pulex TaxID=6669 RepID=E9HUW6_DAPPU|nr:hypothetical protein DAPPUDRAFT_334162 [Daphnia pulex]|eukprot:EFX64466.1 hypothetical protein DAPPUDRAFT_334162 [Daphnia pulex]